MNRHALLSMVSSFQSRVIERSGGQVLVIAILMNGSPGELKSSSDLARLVRGESKGSQQLKVKSMTAVK